MAKHKKKTSEPTPEPEESKKETIESEPEAIPDTEEVTPTPTPPSEPSKEQTMPTETEKKLNKLFWLRVGLAILAGTAATFIFEGIEGEERRWASIGFMIIIFAATIVVAKGMKMQLPSSDRKKIVTQGIGSYIFLYLFIWIVTYTLANAGNVSNGINI